MDIKWTHGGIEFTGHTNDPSDGEVRVYIDTADGQPWLAWKLLNVPSEMEKTGIISSAYIELDRIAAGDYADYVDHVADLYRDR